MGAMVRTTGVWNGFSVIPNGVDAAFDSEYPVDLDVGQAVRWHRAGKRWALNTNFKAIATGVNEVYLDSASPLDGGSSAIVGAYGSEAAGNGELNLAAPSEQTYISCGLNYGLTGTGLIGVAGTFQIFSGNPVAPATQRPFYRQETQTGGYQNYKPALVITGSMSADDGPDNQAILGWDTRQDVLEALIGRPVDDVITAWVDGRAINLYIYKFTTGPATVDYGTMEFTIKEYWEYAGMDGGTLYDPDSGALLPGRDPITS